MISMKRVEFSATGDCLMRRLKWSKKTLIELAVKVVTSVAGNAKKRAGWVSSFHWFGAELQCTYAQPPP